MSGPIKQTNPDQEINVSYQMNAMTPNGQSLDIRWTDMDEAPSVMAVGAAGGTDYPIATDAPMSEVLLHFTMFLDRVDGEIEERRQPIVVGEKTTLRYDNYMAKYGTVTAVDEIDNGFVVTFDQEIRSATTGEKTVEPCKIFVRNNYQWNEAPTPNLDVLLASGQAFDF